jgi:hypothetical protein
MYNSIIIVIYNIRYTPHVNTSSKHRTEHHTNPIHFTTTHLNHPPEPDTNKTTPLETSTPIERAGSDIWEEYLKGCMGRKKGDRLGGRRR